MGVIQATLMLFLIFFGLMFVGVPISVSIGVASISILLTGFDLNALAYIVPSGVSPASTRLVCLLCRSSCWQAAS